MTGVPEIIHHFSAEKAREGFLRHLRPAPSYFQSVWRSRALVWNFFRRELMGRFHGSYGGIAWVLAQPLFLFAIFYLVFGVLFAPRDEFRATGPSLLFALYLFAGILAFHGITEGVQHSLSIVVTNGNLVKKVAFPCELLPLIPVGVSLVVYVVGCLVMVAIGVPTGVIHLGLELLAWPLLIACLLLFSLGLGLLLAGAYVFARDLSHLWGLFVQAWFFLSPVFWRMPMVREKAEDLGAPWVMNLFLLNPAYPMLLAQRQVFGIGAELPPGDYAAQFPLSLAENLGWSAVWAAAMFFVGYAFFMSRKRKFADLV